MGTRRGTVMMRPRRRRGRAIVVGPPRRRRRCHGRHGDAGDRNRGDGVADGDAHADAGGLDVQGTGNRRCLGLHCSG